MALNTGLKIQKVHFQKSWAGMRGPRASFRSSLKVPKRKMKRMLSAKRYRREAFDSYIEIIDKYREFLLRNCELFDIEHDHSQISRQ